jgi:hypothetical protein
LAIVCSASAADKPARPTTAPAAKVARLELEVARGGAFGDADPDDIDAVLRSAGRELQQFAGGDVPAIRVFRGGPIVLYRRLSGNVIAMKLDVGGSYWAQFSFQFAHELCHILCGYRETVSESNKWFEESLCETASLFVLRRMAQTWKTDAPYKNWRGYAPHLGEYAAARIKASPLPEGKTLAEWRRDNAEAMEKDPTDRPRNNIVAVRLLPLFEAEPQHWAAVRHLNDFTPERKETLQEYLQRWHDHTPAEHQAFVRKIAGELGVKLMSK